MNVFIYSTTFVWNISHVNPLPANVENKVSSE